MINKYNMINKLLIKNNNMINKYNMNKKYIYL